MTNPSNNGFSWLFEVSDDSECSQAAKLKKASVLANILLGYREIEIASNIVSCSPFNICVQGQCSFFYSEAMITCGIALHLRSGIASTFKTASNGSG